VKEAMERISEKLLKIIQVIAGSLFLMVFLVNILRIALRNVIGVTWFWIPGFSRLTFIWVVFLGAAALYARDDHLVMDFFIQKMRTETIRKMDIFFNLVFLVFITLFTVYGYFIFRIRMRIPYTTWNFPTGYAYLAAPVSGVLMLFFCLDKLRKLFSKKEENKHANS